jgi:hypothetical protein
VLTSGAHAPRREILGSKYPRKYNFSTIAQCCLSKHTHSGKGSEIPLELLAVGYRYEDFEQVSDEEVAELIERFRGAKVGEINDSDT